MLDGLRASTPDNTLPAYAWPGGYQMIYFTHDGSIVCPACANDVDTSDPVVGAEVYWEGPPIICDNCYSTIESAYGDPDADDTDDTDSPTP